MTAQGALDLDELFMPPTLAGAMTPDVKGPRGLHTADSELGGAERPPPPDAGEPTHAHATGSCTGQPDCTCPRCRYPQQPGSPKTNAGYSMEAELAELERTNPEVAQAAADYDKMSAHIRATVKMPLDFDCPHDRCDAKAGERCRAGIRSGYHSVRSALAPDSDPKCARVLNHVNKNRCKSRRSQHDGPDLQCPVGTGRFQYEAPRGMASFSAGEVDLLDKLVRGTLHGRSMEAAAQHPDMAGLRAKVNGLSAQVARRHAERGDDVS